MRLLLILSLLPMLLLTACASGPERHAPSTHRGYEAVKAGQLGEAQELLQAAMARDPGDPYTLLNLAALYHNTGRHDDARHLYGRVIALGSTEEVPRGTYPAESSRSITAIAQRRLDELMAVETARLEREAQERREAERRREAEMARLAAAEALPNETFWVQTGFFRSEETLTAHRKDLAQKYGNRDIRLFQSKDGTRVRLGPFDSWAAARGTCRSLREKGTDCFAVRLEAEPPADEIPLKLPRWGRYR